MNSLKGKIDKDGILSIERAGVMRQQMCPYSYSNQLPVFSATQCGDACPLFDEPYPERGTTSVMLCICHEKRLFFKEFTDERKVQEKKEPEQKAPQQEEPKPVEPVETVEVVETVEPVAVEGEYPETFF